MAEEKNILEEAIIQMKNLEEAVAENAKGILDSVMRKEIKELVKESLNEQDDEDEVESDEMDFEDSDVADVEFPDEDMDDEDMEDMDDEDMEDMDDEDMEDMDDEDMEDMDDEDMEATIDLRNEPMENVLKVFSRMKDTDTISVEEDGDGNIHLSDDDTDKEYFIVREGLGEYDEEMDMEMDEEMEMEMDETIYEIEMDEEMDMEMGEEMYGEMEMDEEMDMEMDETIYEIEMDEEMDMEMDEADLDSVMESIKKKGFKPKGMNLGDAKSYQISKNPNREGGFKVVKTKADKTMGTGSASSFKYGKGENLDGEFKIKPKAKKESKEGMMKTPKKMETKEASRTYGMGSKSGRGLRKGITPNRNLTFESMDTQEVNLLREKNEEYRKALNVFRNKLNEVAVFNSNLAYATRLFTEHSTSKQEKINILKRFDSVDTLKESKNLYKTIKDELTSSKGQQVNESIERTIQKTPSTGSAVNLIESKTYENPQFLRMKDLMSKLK